MREVEQTASTSSYLFFSFSDTKIIFVCGVWYTKEYLSATASSTPPEPEKLAAQVETVTISDPVAPEASSAAPSEAAAPKEQPPSAAPVQEPIAQVRPARAAPPLALNPDEDIAPRPAVPAKTPGGGPNQAAAGAGNQDRVRIDPSSGQILGAPAARANRVPPGGFSSGGFW